MISESLSTVLTDESPQANMAGHGVSMGRSNGYSKFFEEHGHVVTVLSCIPRTGYMQGVNKMYRRLTNLDYYWPEFANLGEQAVINSEIYYDPEDDLAENVDTFGYQSRYAEYKYIPSTVHGKFRTDLDFWHMARKFSSRPPLNGGFVQADPTTRVFAVGSEDPTVEHLYLQVYNKVDALRPIPYFSTPNIG